jgi:hypothetical protein
MAQEKLYLLCLSSDTDKSRLFPTAGGGAYRTFAVPEFISLYELFSDETKLKCATISDSTVNVEDELKAQLQRGPVEIKMREYIARAIAERMIVSLTLLEVWHAYRKKVQHHIPFTPSVNARD